MKKRPNSNLSSCFHNIDAYFVNIFIVLSDSSLTRSLFSFRAQARLGILLYRQHFYHSPFCSFAFQNPPYYLKNELIN